MTRRTKPSDPAEATSRRPAPPPRGREADCAAEDDREGDDRRRLPPAGDCGDRFQVEQVVRSESAAPPVAGPSTGAGGAPVGYLVSNSAVANELTRARRGGASSRRGRTREECVVDERARPDTPRHPARRTPRCPPPPATTSREDAARLACGLVGGAAKTTLEIPWTSRTACRRRLFSVAARNEATWRFTIVGAVPKTPSLRRAPPTLDPLRLASHRLPVHFRIRSASQGTTTTLTRTTRQREIPYRVVPRFSLLSPRSRSDAM